MTLQPGRMLSQYRLIEKIGQGGMGIVYKAADTRLRRTAAIKVLSPELVSNPERRLRFEREAQAAAALNHPNIAVIYEIGEDEGLPFIAMEYVEGKSLRALADVAPLPTLRAVRIALQVAAGIGRAHQSGIVHRDLKPENVIVMGDGQVKILDFGLAKLRADEREEATPDNASRLETISREGRILGTAAYMSPEQIRGESVDQRSDLFSFGVLLYELLTGRAPFDGQTAMDTLSSILRDAPAPAATLNPGLAPEMERILSKCLEKDPADRYQSSADLVVDLRRFERQSDSHPDVLQAAEAPARRERPARVPAGA
ncbi:MAG TPA: serine/threonine-protein kinase, partial [Candidatus Saccharimonadales bacterium]|nr:serine/threonine-protein kinase [Candidatus Saccharimonadales bacterium]